jgi:hypothetical protein
MPVLFDIKQPIEINAVVDPLRLHILHCRDLLHIEFLPVGDYVGDGGHGCVEDGGDGAAHG